MASVGDRCTNRQEDVRTIQRMLNNVPAAAGGPATSLAVDGLCWSKTVGAIRRFQEIGCGFKWPDGKISPDKRTFLRLEELQPVTSKVETATGPAPRTACGVAHGLDLDHLFSDFDESAFDEATLQHSSRPSYGSPSLHPSQSSHGWHSKGFAPPFTTFQNAAPARPSLSRRLGRLVPKPLSPTQLGIAVATFGASIDYRRVLVVMAPPPGGAVGLCYPGPGKFRTLFLSNNSRRLLVHELAHVWQSQHHTDSTQYAKNSLASQALAAALGQHEYAYRPGKPFGGYAAEQIAQMVENGHPGVLHQMRLTLPGAVHAGNVASLLLPRCEEYPSEGVVLWNGFNGHP